ncbi:MAG: hypothetical protein P1T08_04400 [Acidimicrobiia bacterium]|nr:hypothetical protein [Acidimicrobiia bacterium]
MALETAGTTVGSHNLRMSLSPDRNVGVLRVVAGVALITSGQIWSALVTAHTRFDARVERSPRMRISRPSVVVRYVDTMARRTEILSRVASLAQRLADQGARAVNVPPLCSEVALGRRHSGIVVAPEARQLESRPGV